MFASADPCITPGMITVVCIVVVAFAIAYVCMPDKDDPDVF